MTKTKTILIVGMNPYTIDFSQPGFLPGLTAEQVEKGIQAEIENLKNAGLSADMYLIDSGSLDLTELIQKFKQSTFDGVMIGAGVRIPPVNFILFELLINVIHENASGSKIIFNTNPMDTKDAIMRWI